MLAAEAPKFLITKRAPKLIKGLGKPSQNLKKSKKHRKYDESRGDLGTPEFRARMLERDIASMSEAQQKQYFSGQRGRLQAGITIEARERSSTGHEISRGARVENQLPHDRYKTRNQLDPDNAWRNTMLWEGAERLRRDFDMSGMAPRTCSSFEPRVSGGNQTWQAETRGDAEKRYKKAMNAIGLSLRSVVFYVCIQGEAADSWARRNAKASASGIISLRHGLSELAHHYGLMKLSAG